jgi:hypothetical protein
MLAPEANPVLDAMIRNQWMFPVTECIHILAFAVSIGTISVVDLSLLNLGFGGKAAGVICRSVEPWTLLSLVLVVFSGLLLFATDPDHYYLNSAFQLKISALTVALIWNYTIHRKIALSDASPSPLRKLAGGVSLALWVSVVFGGLFIGFVS